MSNSTIDINSLHPNQWIFVPHPVHAYLPIKIQSITNQHIVGNSIEGETIKYDYTKNNKKSLNDIELINENIALQSVHNLVELSELSEASILHNLRQRYEADQIYTNTSSIVLSINPYKLLPCYGPSTIRQYRRDLQHITDVTTSHRQVLPHVYVLADSAYKELIQSNKNQSILISGESGAGKTEATKLVLQYLAECSHTQRRENGAASSVTNSPNARDSYISVEQQILDANPIIEAFGNAKTVRNNNSSRFGKWMEIVFDKHGKIASSRIESYLLEKSRVTHHALNERNYHIFYFLTCGCSQEERDRYMLDTASKYRILTYGLVNNNTDHISNDSTDTESPYLGNNAVKQWQEVLDAMRTLEFTDTQIDGICRILSAVLHLGNVIFEDTGNDKAIITNAMDSVEIAAKMLGIDVNELSNLLLTKTLMIAGKPIVTFNTSTAASDIRDAICKNLYEKLFLSLMSIINQVLHWEVKKSIGTIGLLDIFGFENFESGNYFEQLLINYTNEQLQQHFTHQIFVMEQAEYKEEEINLPYIQFNDNQGCLDLIGGKNTGIIDSISEELRLPKGNDSNLLQRMHQQYATNKYYAKPKTKSETFTVKHYANDVIYQIQQFCEKNKDTMPESVKALINTSSHTFIASLYDTKNLMNLTSSTTSATGSMKSGGKSNASQSNATLGNQFKQQLGNLMLQLHQTEPHFIRCIKPNQRKMADLFDSQFVSKQLQYLGIKQVIQVRQSGYAIRKPHAEFYARYKILLTSKEKGKINRRVSNKKLNIKSQCQEVMDYIFRGVASRDVNGVTMTLNDYRIGKSKVLMRNHVQSVLEYEHNEKIIGTVLYLQSLARRKLQRKRYIQLKSAVQQLNTLLSSKSEDIVELDSTLGLCVEYNAPHRIIAKARHHRNYIYELVSTRQSLSAAIDAKDIQLLSAAIQRANGLEPSPTSQQLPDLHKAQQLLIALRAHISKLSEAVKLRDLDAINQQLQVATSLGLESTLQRDARTLAHRLETEKQCIAKLTYAVEQQDIALLQEAINYGDEIGLSNKSTHLHQAKSLYAELQRTASARALIRGSIESQDINAISQALNEAKKVGITAKDPLYVEALECMEMLRKASKAQAVTNAIQLAIDQRNIELLMSSIKLAESQGLSDHQLTQKARTMLQREEVSNTIEQSLRQAIEVRDITRLQSSIQKAKQSGITDTTSYSAAEKLYGKFCTAIDALQAAINREELHELEKAINRATDVGLPDTNPIYQQAKQLRDQQANQQDDNTMLMHAIRSKDLSLLIQAIEKCSHLSSTHPLMKQAQSAIEELRAEKLVREMDAANDQKKRVLSANQKRGAAMTGTLLPGTLIRKNSLSQYMDEWRSNKYSVHLFPLLRAPDDYAKGKLLGKAKLKQSMLVHSKEVIPRSLTRLGDNSDTDELNLLALQIFKSILGYMGDRTYTFPDTLASEILSTGITYPALRDEIYMQLIKQVTQNPRPDSVLRGWQLLGLLSETFPPTGTALPYVFKFLFTYHEIKSFAAADYVNYTMKTLTLNKPPLTKTPFIQHISGFKDRLMSSAFITITLPDSSTIQLLVEATMDCQNIVQHIGNTIKLKSEYIPLFGIFRVHTQASATQQENRASYNSLNSSRKQVSSNVNNTLYTAPDLYLHDNECLLDFGTNDSSFVFRKRMLPEQDDAYNDSVCSSIIYHQLMSDIVAQRYTLPRDQLILIQAIHERELEKDQQIGATIPNHRFMKAYDLAVYPVCTSHQDVIDFHTSVQYQLEQLSNDVLPLSILEIIRGCSNEIGCYWYSVTQDGSHMHLPHQLLIGVNLYGFFIKSADNQKTLLSWPYTAINGWANNSNRFCIRVYDADKCVEQLNFNTKQGARITYVIQLHVDHLLKIRQARKAAQKQMELANDAALVRSN